MDRLKSLPVSFGISPTCSFCVALHFTIHEMQVCVFCTGEVHVVIGDYCPILPLHCIHQYCFRYMHYTVVHTDEKVPSLHHFVLFTDELCFTRSGILKLKPPLLLKGNKIGPIAIWLFFFVLYHGIYPVSYGTELWYTLYIKSLLLSFSPSISLCIWSVC
jgi:hypothetical protein